MASKSRLTDLGYAGRSNKHGKRYHRYRCDCGVEKEIIRSEVRSGNTSSCGCFQRDSRRTHGKCGAPSYLSWHAMKARCKGRGVESTRRRYEQRGISYDPTWETFEGFYADMGDRPPGLTLDRIDNDKGYSKENCRWTSRAIQARNVTTRRATNKSGYKGVSWDRERSKWFVCIWVHGKTKALGRFNSKTEAARAYNEEARKHEGFSLNQT